MRRKPGTLIPLELAILAAGLDLQTGGSPEFHGYALARHMADREQARRLTGHGTLYRALDRLERLGFVECRSEDPTIAAAASRPIRMLYRVTAIGEQACAAAAREQPTPSRRFAAGEA